MSDIETAKRRRYQFGPRRLLLWTAVAALGLGLLSFTEPPLAGWVLVPGWLTTVLAVRWTLGGRWAVTASIVIGMLLYACDDYLHSARPGVVIFSGLIGGLMGIGSYALVVTTLRAVNRLDRIGQADG